MSSKFTRLAGLMSLLVAAVLLSATPAQAAPADTIMDGLKRSPVYVDPALASAMPKASQRRLEQRIEATGLPIYVVIVPLVQGDSWDGDPEQLASVVHDRLNRDAIIVTPGEDFGARDLEAYEWPEDEHQASRAASAVFFMDELKEAGLAARLTKTVEIIKDGNGDQVYEEVTADLGRSTPRPSASPDAGGPAEGSSGWPAWATALIVVVVLATTWLVVRARRRRAVPRAGVPQTVFATVRAADADRLRERARTELLELGETLENTDSEAEAGHADLQRALDAYEAAGKVLDEVPGDSRDALPDLAGALVLIDQGRRAHAAATARAAGREAAEPVPPCFFNPLHGDSVRQVTWRPVGQRRRLKVQACRDCAQALRARRAPEVLADGLDGREVPYFEVPAERSVWAATGFGALRDDLIERILRGEDARR